MSMCSLHQALLHENTSIILVGKPLSNTDALFKRFDVPAINAGIKQLPSRFNAC